MNEKQNERRTLALWIVKFLSPIFIILPFIFISMPILFGSTYNGELVIWSGNHVIGSYEFVTNKPFNEIISLFQNSSNITLTTTNIIFNQFNQTTIIGNNSGMLITNNIWYLSNMNNTTIHMSKNNLRIYTIEVKTLLVMYHSEILFNNSFSQSDSPIFNNMKISITEYPIKTPIVVIIMSSLFIIGLVSQNIRLRNFEKFRITLTLLSKHRDIFIILNISLALSMILLGVGLYIYDFPLMLVSSIMYLIVLFVLLAVLPSTFLLEIMNLINKHKVIQYIKISIDIIILGILYFLNEILFFALLLILFSIIILSLLYPVLKLLFFKERNLLTLKSELKETTLLWISKITVIFLFAFLLIFLLAVKYVVYFISLSLSFYPSYALFSVAIQIIAIVVNYFVRIIRSSRNRIINYGYRNVIIFITFVVWFFVYTRTIVRPITVLSLYYYYKINFSIINDFFALLVFMLFIATYIGYEYEYPRNDKNGSKLISILAMHFSLFIIIILWHSVHIFVEFFILSFDFLFVTYLLHIYAFVRFLNSKISGGMKVKLIRYSYFC